MIYKEDVGCSANDENDGGHWNEYKYEMNMKGRNTSHLFSDSESTLSSIRIVLLFQLLLNDGFMCETKRTDKPDNGLDGKGDEQ